MPLAPLPCVGTGLRACPRGASEVAHLARDRQRTQFGKFGFGAIEFMQAVQTEQCPNRWIIKTGKKKDPPPEHGSAIRSVPSAWPMSCWQ